MAVLDTIITILHIVISVALIAVVLFQQDKNAGLSGAIGGGGAESFFGKNKGRSLNGILSKLTVWLAVVFVLTTCYLSGVITNIVSAIGSLFR